MLAMATLLPRGCRRGTRKVPARARACARRDIGLIRWVLLVFLLSLGVAIASPVIQPQSLDVVCASAGGMRLVVQDDDGAGEPTGLRMDCPLCALAAPPPAEQVALSLPRPMAGTARSIPSVRIGTATTAPLPARGPPLTC